MKNKNQWLLGLGLAVALAACGKDKNESPKGGSAAAAQGDWTLTQHRVSADGSVVFDEKQMTKMGLEAKKEIYQRSNLQQLPIDGHFKTQVFRITDNSIGDYANKVFIAPKIFSYGSQQSGKVGRINNPDGSVTLSFNIAIVDGSTKTLQSPQGDEKEVEVPESFIVQDPQGLKQLLKTDYHADNGLAPLPGCIKKLTLKVGLDVYDVTPVDLKSADFCQLNAPFSVSVRLSNQDAKRVLEQDLYDGFADISGVFETRVSIPSLKVDISMNRSKVSKDLRMKLGIKAFFTDIEVQKVLTSVVEEQLSKVAIQGTPSAYVEQLVKQATQEFFEPFLPDAKNPQSECGGAAVCLRYSDVLVEDSRTLNLSWSQDTNAMVGLSYVTSTKLKPTPTKMTIGKERNCTENCERLVNDGKPRETGLTVHEGTTLVLEPNYVVRENKVAASPTTVRINHEVKIPIGMSIGTITQNQWVDSTTVVDSSVDEIVDQPVGRLNELFGGISLQFTRFDSKIGTKVVQECPLGSFPRYGDGQSMTFELHNSPSCQIFSDDPKELTSISIISRIGQDDILEFRNDRKDVTWDGKTSESLDTLKHTRKIELSGTLTVIGEGILTR